jgi:cyclopropane fatty-acyl-phospholipid synthase-like methyltransferase
LNRGRAHVQLGTRQFASNNVAGTVPLHDTKSFASRGRELFEAIRALGLEPSHSVVDYGCGSLRVGQHFIRFLDSRNYIGLDVTDRFYLDGLSMLDRELLEAKQPGCEVISQRSLAATASRDPDFVVSIAVLKHVPPGELGHFFDNLAQLVKQHTRLVLVFTESDAESRIKGKSWSWTFERVARMITERCPGHSVTRVFKIPREIPRNCFHTMILAAPPELMPDGLDDVG